MGANTGLRVDVPFTISADGMLVLLRRALIFIVRFQLYLLTFYLFRCSLMYALSRH